MNLGPGKPEYGASLSTEWMPARQVIIPGHCLLAPRLEVTDGRRCRIAVPGGGGGINELIASPIKSGITGREPTERGKAFRNKHQRGRQLDTVSAYSVPELLASISQAEQISGVWQTFHCESSPLDEQWFCVNKTMSDFLVSWYRKETYSKQAVYHSCNQSCLGTRFLDLSAGIGKDLNTSMSKGEKFKRQEGD